MNEQKKTLVSIGLPVYNAEHHIRRALDSLLAQTYQSFELIISDNASSDATAGVCEEYVSRDPRIRFIRQKENRGRINNFLLVLAQARGPYFMWAGDDDWWAPEFLETLVQGLDTHPDHGVALSSFWRIGAEGTLVDTVSFSEAGNFTDMSYAKVFKKIVTHEPIHIFFSGLWRTDILHTLTAVPFANTIAWDRIMVAEAALMTHFYSASPILFDKYSNPISIKSRHTNDPEQKRYRIRFAYLRYLMVLFSRIMTSPLIPWYRKIYVPLPWLQNIWMRRKRIFWVLLRDLRSLVTN